MRASSVLCQQLGCGTAVTVPGQAWFGEGSDPTRADVFDCHGNETRLSQCAVSSWSRAACSHGQDVGVICSGSALSALDGTVRLSGESGCEGQVEVYYQQAWSTVLESWSFREASVVCRQLGCGSAVKVYSSSLSGMGNSGVCLTGFQCSGRESHLGNCSGPHNLTCGSSPQVSIVCSKLGQTDCGHKKDVGVVCSESMEMRLTEGCSGKLEVFYNGTWGNVCFNDMRPDTVSLICQELNCGKSGFLYDTRPRLKSAPNWLDFFNCRAHDSTLLQCPSRPWGQNECTNREVARITCKAEEDTEPRSRLSCSSAANHRACTNHLPLRLRGGEGGCSGRLEVFHRGSWGTVCDDSWDLRDVQVVCRQLGCGPAKKAHGNATFGRGNGTIWLNEVKCRGTELHLWDCPHSLQQHSSCEHQNDAGVTCTDYSSDSTTTTEIPATTTTVPPKQVSRPRQTPPSLPIAPVAFVVLGALFFLLLVVLGVLLLHNRALRRALSPGDHAPLHEAIYEEIELTLARGGTYNIRRQGSVVSEDPPSGYEDVGGSEGHSLSEDLVMEDMPENYDDVITADQHPGSVAGELVKGDPPEYYDDVITMEESPGDLVIEDTEENYDDAMTLDQSQMRESILAPDGPQAPDEMDYDDVGEEPLEGGGAY
ncbi:hypothetical protein AAFF_G00266660 [Aldrovandia affinis]|uniref:Scavenger receptor cysteine-rich type 1 protein M130-like n=1 Tax=Aldrovandia affinis TaxID=143900 RepID=A0AAD7W2K8_9TELE|nr:hypothetical protein AAFF_G00266660 [Aldrovandia affinis]